ncbi:MAG: DUF3795 domain-containing protein [Clostridiaceae bacterium]|nr:DUF3795 domain-containing protein [Clostridiaceae bacterium]
MKLGGYCPGCGGGAGNQGCVIARCSLEHGGYNYCFECSEYPCTKYNAITEFDSFITHRNQIIDLEKAKSKGMSVYLAKLEQKATILKYLLENYDDGRRKTFFCLAVNLLELSDVKTVIKNLETDISLAAARKEKALVAVTYFEGMAKQNGITLKMNQKPKTHLSK